MNEMTENKKVEVDGVTFDVELELLLMSN